MAPQTQICPGQVTSGICRFCGAMAPARWLDAGKTLCARCGSFSISLPGQPPTVTHHDKSIGMRTTAAGKIVRGLRDSPRLKAVKHWYGWQLGQEHARRPPQALSGPIWMDVVFVFAGDKLDWMIAKPDRDNLCKALQDCLVRDGWIAADQQIVGGLLAKITAPTPFTRIEARILTPELLPWMDPQGNLHLPYE